MFRVKKAFAVAMPPKRPASGSPGIPPGAKAVKTENFGGENFSHQVKEKLKTSTRTGQACDRCKVCMFLVAITDRTDVLTRFARSDAMAYPEDVRHVYKTTKNAGPPIESLAGPP